MKLVTAIVRTQKLKQVEDALVELGIPDVTVSLTFDPGQRSKVDVAR